MRHIPVLVEETKALLLPELGGLVVDCTVGLGGHAAALLEAGPDVRLIGIDQDPKALGLAESRLAPWAERVRLVHGNFAGLEELLQQEGVGEVRAILADLGVSSMQLDTAERGFSFRRDGPLDMRMGPAEVSAAEVVNRYSEAELEKIFREYGEEWKARRIARAIASRRREKPFETTLDLAEVVGRAARGGRRGRPQRIDPATRVFQALRIEVNRELAGLETLIEQAIRLLERDGRLVVISYHSLEDRIVKHRFREAARGEVDPITGRPRSETRVLEVLTGKPIRPGQAELKVNPRSRSARLRAARRL